MLLLCALLAAAGAAPDCDSGSYYPARVTNPNLYAYAVLIVTLNESDYPALYGHMGTVIRDRVVLAEGYVGHTNATRKLRYGVIGASLADIPRDLRGVPIYRAVHVESNPRFRPNWKMSAYNMALLFLERSDKDLVAAWAPHRLRPPEKVVNVYWFYDPPTHRMVKHVMTWCPDLEAVSGKCKFFSRKSYLCLTTRLEGVDQSRLEGDVSFPCAKDAVTHIAGGPLISVENDELLGIFMGIENEGTRHLSYCRQPKWEKIYFVATRLLGKPAGPLEEATFNYHWINKEIERFKDGEWDADNTTECDGCEASTKRTPPFIYPADGAGRLRGCWSVGFVFGVSPLLAFF